MTKEINEKKVLWLSSSNPSCVIVKPLQNLRNCVKDEPPVHEPIATQKNLLYMDLCSLLPDFLYVYCFGLLLKTFLTKDILGRAMTF